MDVTQESTMAKQAGLLNHRDQVVVQQTKELNTTPILEEKGWESTAPIKMDRLSDVYYQPIKPTILEGL